MGRHAATRANQLALIPVAIHRRDSLATSLYGSVANALSVIIRPFVPSRNDATSEDNPAKRILVIELWNIGDVILAMPFLAALRERFPEASVTLLAKPIAADLLSGTGLVDQFIPASLDWSENGLSTFRRGAVLWRVSRQIRRQRFDFAFSARRHLRESLLLSVSGAHRRIGFSFSDREPGLTDAVRIPDANIPRPAEWLRLLDVFAPGPPPSASPRLCVTPEEHAWARGYLRSHAVTSSDVVVGFHPGASLPEKRWPIDRFHAIATELANTPNIRVVAFAEPAPSMYGAELFKIPNVIAASTSLRQLIALIAECHLLVCNDSGPMHIAGALGVPTVAMFGSGIGERFAPLGSGHRLLQPVDGETGQQSPIRSPVGVSVEQARAAVNDALHEIRGERNLSAQ
ncbi:MAG TPA: glycosyltransferase family 9 protein [Gemmatimonadaceae bacterium]|nr:glycosyltransferase family 9 protein [Gemmatimonadaceae bacterium]